MRFILPISALTVVSGTTGSASAPTVSKKMYNEACNALLPGSYCKINVITGQGVCHHILMSGEGSGLHTHTATNPGNERATLSCVDALERVSALSVQAEVEIDQALNEMSDDELIAIVALEDEALHAASTSGVVVIDEASEDDETTVSTVTDKASEKMELTEAEQAQAALAKKAEARAKLVARAKSVVKVTAGLLVAYGIYHYVPEVQEIVNDYATQAKDAAVVGARYASKQATDAAQYAYTEAAKGATVLSHAAAPIVNPASKFMFDGVKWVSTATKQVVAPVMAGGQFVAKQIYTGAVSADATLKELGAQFVPQMSEYAESIGAFMRPTGASI